MDDGQYAAVVQLTIDAQGNIVGSSWMKGSGNSRWDDSVKEALGQIKSVSHAPPKGFPSTFEVRFDVESAEADDNFQISSR